MTETLEARLIDHEGLKLKPYRDTKGKLTIGVGRNLDDRGITREEALYLLANDINLARQEALRIPAYLVLDEARREVLAEMVFNMGLGKVLKFEKMLAAIEAKDYAEAAREMLDSKWAREDVGERAHTLARIMETGVES